MIPCLDFPKDLWKHLKTTIVVESLFSRLRLRAGETRQLEKGQNATAALYKLPGGAESRFKTLHHAPLLAVVRRGEVFVEG